MDPLPRRGMMGAIQPIELEDWREDLEKCTKIAIEHYNKEQVYFFLLFVFFF